jgi:hypothetical protein
MPQDEQRIIELTADSFDTFRQLPILQRLVRR